MSHLSKILNFAVVLVFPLSSVCTWADSELTNYRSGISVFFGGVKGSSYVEEYFYHDKVVNDRKVVYIRSDTLITLEHNDTNIIGRGIADTLGANGKDGIPNSGDEGIIRYRIDGDLSSSRKWSGSGALHPEYTGPFAFDHLSYDQNTPVVGTTGPVPGAQISDRKNFYYRGISDNFGDEWHVLAYADDDRSIQQPKGVDQAWWSSDGKTVLFVVNPKTPALTIRASGEAQFYTTPAKAYYVPKIHDQVTYMTVAGSGVVSFQIQNLYDSNVVYRINGSAWLKPGTRSVTIDHRSFNEGTNILEYYYVGNESFVKKRVVVKNPGFPSDREQHGNALWGTDAEYSTVVQRISRAPYANLYSQMGNPKTLGGNDSWDSTAMKGRRIGTPFILNNAIHARIKGWGAKPSGKSKTYAEYTKEMLLHHIRMIDPIGFELNHSSDAIPSRELHYRGYYDVVPVVRAAFAYDILIAGYRSDLVVSGITPVEDYLIRDTLAGFAFECMQWLGGWTEQEPGMWGISRNIGGLCIGIIMPTYSTPYYGTSGFDGQIASALWAPYPNQAITWKTGLLDNDAAIRGYPNLQYRSGTIENSGGLAGPNGEWSDKVAYTTYGLVGQHLEILANILEMHTNKKYPGLTKFFMSGANGTLVGSKDSPQNPRKLTSVTVLNSRFPMVTEAVFSWAKSLVSADPLSINTSLGDAEAFGLVWYDDGASVVGSIPVRPSNLIAK